MASRVGSANPGVSAETEGVPTLPRFLVDGGASRPSSSAEAESVPSAPPTVLVAPLSLSPVTALMSLADDEEEE